MAKSWSCNTFPWPFPIASDTSGFGQTVGLWWRPYKESKTEIPVGWVVQRETGYANGVGRALAPLFSREHAHVNGPHARNHFDHREVGWTCQSTEHRLVTKSHAPGCKNKKAFENHYYIKWNDNSFMKCLPWAFAIFNSHKQLPKMHYCILLFSRWGYGVSVRLIRLSCSHSFSVADGEIIPMITDPCIFFYHDVGLRSGDLVIWWSAELFYQLEVSSDIRPQSTHDLGVPELSHFPPPIERNTSFQHLPNSLLHQIII